MYRYRLSQTGRHISYDIFLIIFYANIQELTRFGVDMYGQKVTLYWFYTTTLLKVSEQNKKNKQRILKLYFSHHFTAHKNKYIQFRRMLRVNITAYRTR